jgi:hypothetical protein
MRHDARAAAGGAARGALEHVQAIAAEAGHDGRSLPEGAAGPQQRRRGGWAARTARFGARDGCSAGAILINLIE